MRLSALVRVLTIAALLAACSSTTTTTAPTSAPGRTTGATPAPTSPGSASADSLPAPSLTDPAQINAALFDPARVDVGVVSLLAQLGIAIDADDGSSLRAGSGTALPDFHLRAAEVLGLIEMGRADAVSIASGRAPWTLTDLAGGLAPLFPGLTQADVLGRYIDAYRAAPGDLVRAILDGHPFLAQTAFSRVHLWLLLVDGVLGRHGPAARSGSAMTVALRETAAGPVATVNLPFIPSPIPGLDARDYALLLAHLPLLGYQVPLALTIAPGQAHEGHGGAGPTVAIDARHGSVPSPLLSIVDGHPILLPIHSGLDGVPISFESADSATLEQHGVLLGTLGAPILTDATGLAHLGYQLLPEEANGVGDLKSTSATVEAVVDLRQLVVTQYAVDPSILALVWGARRTPSTLEIDWHEKPAPTGNGAGTFDITLFGKKAGAGHYVGTAESYCSATTQGGQLFWSVVAQPKGSNITEFDMAEAPNGRDSLEASVANQTEIGPWIARSGDAGFTADVTASGGGQNIRMAGHGSWTDSAGNVYTIDMVAECAIVLT